MTSLSTPLNRAAPRTRFAGGAILTLVLALVVVAVVLIAMNAASVDIGAPSAGYDAPHYSEYVQDMAQGW
jgi:hypothetical protein